MTKMSCPRCGLTVAVRVSFMTLRHCPRCLAQVRISVPMLTAGPETAPAPDETSLGQLVIRSISEPDRLVLELLGELDLASAPALQRRLDAALAQGVAKVVVDLSRLAFLDSTGLQVLLFAHRRLLENGQGLTLRRGPRAIQRLFEVTHTLAVFRFEPAPPAGRPQ